MAISGGEVHFLLVNRKMQAAANVRVGSKCEFAWSRTWKIVRRWST